MGRWRLATYSSASWVKEIKLVRKEKKETENKKRKTDRFRSASESICLTHLFGQQIDVGLVASGRRVEQFDERQRLGGRRDRDDERRY